MTNRTWIGGRNNEASNPNNWSPTGSPKPGDTLLIDDGGMINITGKALAGDVLSIEPTTGGLDPSLNLVNANVTLNMMDQPTLIESVENLHFILNATGTDSVAGSLTDAIVNLKGNAHLLLSGKISFLGITGGSGSEIVNDGTINLVPGSGSTTFTTNLTGRGVIEINQQSELALTIDGAVGQGQTIDIIGNNDLTLDKPVEFSGTIDLQPGSPSGFAVTLMGLVATSYEFGSDTLSLFNGNHLIDTLKITDRGASLSTTVGIFGIVQGSLGLSIDYGEPHPATNIPVHS